MCGSEMRGDANVGACTSESILQEIVLREMADWRIPEEYENWGYIVSMLNSSEVAPQTNKLYSSSRTVGSV